MVEMHASDEFCPLAHLFLVPLSEIERHSLFKSGRYPKRGGAPMSAQGRESGCLLGRPGSASARWHAKTTLRYCFLPTPR